MSVRLWNRLTKYVLTYLLLTSSFKYPGLGDPDCLMFVVSHCCQCPKSSVLQYLRHRSLPQHCLLGWADKSTSCPWIAVTQWTEWCSRFSQSPTVCHNWAPAKTIMPHLTLMSGLNDDEVTYVSVSNLCNKVQINNSV